MTGRNGCIKCVNVFCSLALVVCTVLKDYVHDIFMVSLSGYDESSSVFSIFGIDIRSVL